MSILHDVLHRIVDRLPFASDEHAAAAHAEVDAIPRFVEQIADEQLDAELGDKDAATAAPEQG